jgi:hypothetical protein
MSFGDDTLAPRDKAEIERDELKREAAEWKEQARVQDLQSTTLAFQIRELRRGLEEFECVCYTVEDGSPCQRCKPLALTFTQAQKVVAPLMELMEKHKNKQIGKPAHCGEDGCLLCFALNAAREYGPLH